MPEINPNPATAAAAPDEVITRVVVDIRAVKRDTDLQQMFGVVNVVIEAFFQGDLAVYRERGEGDPSVRKLAAHPDLPFSGVTIYRYLRICDMADRIGGLHHYPHLELSHFREVLGLPVERQISLLKEANAGHWSVDQLSAAVSPERVRTEADRSRHLHGEVDRALRDLARIADEREGLVADMASLNYSPEAGQRIASLLGALRGEIQKLHEGLPANRKRSAAASSAASQVAAQAGTKQ